MMTSFCSPEVFINFRGAELRENFISHLHNRLKSNGINAFIDSDEAPGEKLENLFKRIEKSKIALAVLSSRYTESHWCLEELVKMMECSMKGVECNNNLLVIPILYKLKVSTVSGLEGAFGHKLWDLWRLSGCGRDRDNRIVKWNQALEDVLSRHVLILAETGQEEDTFLSDVVTHVKNALSRISLQDRQKPKPKPQKGGNPKPEIFQSRALKNTEAVDQRLKQLEVYLDVEYCNDEETRIVGVVGMPGIGKTYLAEKVFDKLKRKITRYVLIPFEREKSQEQGSEWVQKRLVKGLLDQDCTDLNACEVWKESLNKDKVVIFFDNVSNRNQIEPLLSSFNWIKKGSRIIITTRDKSLVEGLEYCDLYEVPGLNEKDGLELLRSQLCCNLEGNYMELCRKFVEYSGGNPLALVEFGKELKGKDKDRWEESPGTLTLRFKTELGTCYNELNEQQKDAFLDIACFFRSQDENYVRSLLDSYDHEFPESGQELKDLVDKFLIGVCDGRVEMHSLLFTMALLKATAEKTRLLLSNCEETEELKIIERRDKIRGIVLDMSCMEEMALGEDAFVGMSGLRYLKVYNSLCPSHSETECKLNLPDGVQFPEHNIIRYFHWVKFPGKELPSNFPQNLVDLRLPYSNITSLRNCAKDAPNLKWVDLSHSSKLNSLLGLSKAPNLLRLNLEGCTSLEKLPEEMQEMSNLIFLNLKGCTSLLFLPKITINSLKTLILSGCSKFHTLKVISEHLETLYLDGTAIKELPSDIDNLHRLILLSLKDCKNLETLPDCLGKLKSLQELKLSHCSELKSFLIEKENMVKLRVLLLDETSIAEIPINIINSSLLRRLCLSKNDTICSIKCDMDQLFHLKWLELEHCRNLTSLSKLPPNLQCLNAHGCTSLRTVANPVALLMPTDQIHSTFIFTNCHELEQVSKNSLILYVQKKIKMMSHDRYNQNFVFKSLIGTCFPGCEIPSLFNHQALGPVLKLELPQDWNAGRFIGVALCVVVSFKGYNDQSNSLQVKCTCNVSLSSESFVVGGWSERGDGPHTVEADHIFIGYTTLQFSSATEALLRFEVTNGTREIDECKVVKCGFSLVHNSNEADNTPWKGTPLIENQSSFRIAEYQGDDNADTTPTTKYNFFKYLFRDKNRQ